MDYSRKKNLRAGDPRRAGGQKSNRNTGKGPDRGTIVLAFVALLLLVLVIVFLGRGRPRGGRETVIPVIKRVAPPGTDPEPVEPVIELGTPELIQEKPEPENAEKLPVVEQTAARLFFVRVSDEGKIGQKSILRNVPASSSPLTVAVNALLEGPRPGELTNDMMSLIPERSKLLGARVESGIAFLDFNEEFRFNTLGIEGYQAQVEQLVYTVTEFPTVNKVQILIEGQRIDYLGGEGFWVGAPLGREDFSMASLR